MRKRRKEAKKSMVDIMKERINKSAGGSMFFLKFKNNEKRRIRFLTDVNEAMLVTFHDNFKKGVGNPCYKYFGRSSCPFCNKTKEDGYRTRDLFVFTVYDYETNEVKLITEAANDCSPIPHMLENFEEFGTLTDRDYIVKRRGKGFDTSYTLIPGSERPFKGVKKFKALDEDEVFEKLKERYLSKMKDILKKIKNGTFDDEEDLEDDEEEFKPRKKSKNIKLPRKKTKKKTKFERYYDEEEFEEEEDENELDLDDEDDDYDDDEYDD